MSMSGYAGQGRLQDGEWLMRATMVLNRDRPAHADEITPETPLNAAFTQQAAEFETLLDQIDPEGDIDRDIFPMVAYFNAAESWPLDIILSAFGALGVYLFMPYYYGLGDFIGYTVIIAFLAIQLLRARRKRQLAEVHMRRLRLNPDEKHPLTLRMLVRYRQHNVTIH